MACNQQLTEMFAPGPAFTHPLLPYRAHFIGSATARAMAEAGADGSAIDMVAEFTQLVDAATALATFELNPIPDDKLDGAHITVGGLYVNSPDLDSALLLS